MNSTIIELEDEIVNTRIKLSELDKRSADYDLKYQFYNGYLTGLLFAYNTLLDEK